ncbi:hypothetical protein [Streptosporangium sp. KLBMP 9127]|nr:hypothetical protein [Streptosporangium sp. KLBMP 9127]
MEALVLGVAWLLIAPCCLLLLFRGRPLLRITSVLTLALLEVATVGLNHSMRHVELNSAASGPAAGRAVQPVTHRCASSRPIPEGVRLAHARRGLRAVTVWWPATPGECDTATVTWRRKDHRLTLWLQEGDLVTEPPNSVTLPVGVDKRGVASVTLRLALPPGRYQVLDGRTRVRIPRR